MRLILLHGGVVLHADVLVHVKVEQRPGLAARLLGYEVIERGVLGNDQILLDIHEAAHRCSPAPVQY